MTALEHFAAFVAPAQARVGFGVDVCTRTTITIYTITDRDGRRFSVGFDTLGNFLWYEVTGYDI